MIKLSYVPIEMKKGVIITLYKGGNKRKDDPDSYRAITLSSFNLLKFNPNTNLMLITINLPINLGVVSC